MSKSWTSKASVDNILWAYVSFFSTKVLNLVAIIVLARYLEPAEFGIMAICIAVIGYCEIIAQFGVGSALISAQDRVEETASSVAVLAFVISSAVALVLWLAAPRIAELYDSAILEDILAILALTMIVRALGTVNASFLSRELQFRRKVIPEIARGLVKGLVSIGLAITGFGVWSLVFGYIAGSIAGSIAVIIVRPWRPTQFPSRATTLGVLRYGSHLIVAETINSTPRLLDNILVGKVLGTSALGIYSLAFRFPELGIKSFTTVAGSVFHPVMSMIQSDPAALRDYYYGSLRYSAILMFGCGALIAVTASPLVQVLYSPKWYGMIVPMQLLALAFAIGTLNMVQGKVFKAINRTDILFRISLINLPIFVVLIWISVPYGIEAVAFAQILVSIARCIPNYIASRKLLDLTLADTMRALRPAVICAAAVLAIGALSYQVSTGSQLAQLALTTSVASVSYLITLRIFAPEVWHEVSDRVFKKIRRTRKHEAEPHASAAPNDTQGA